MGTTIERIRGALAAGAVAAAALLLTATVSCEEEASAEQKLDGFVASLCRWHFECGCNNATTIAFASQSECEAGLADAILEEVDNKGQVELDTGCAEELGLAFDTLGCSVDAEIPATVELFAAMAKIGQCGVLRGEKAAGDPCTPLAGGLGDDCGADLYCAPVTMVCTQVGTTSEGDTCVTDEECEPGLWCIDPPPLPPGEDEAGDEPPEGEMESETVCGVLPAIGEPCSMTRTLCTVDAYCTAAGTCSALPMPGSACTTSRPTVTDLVCELGSGCNNGLCEAGTIEGQGCGISCALGTACEGGFCRTATATACQFEI